ncbi:MAG: hypothetical protein WC003_14060 [Terrimicrobiaceae bacterium]
MIDKFRKMRDSLALLPLLNERIKRLEEASQLIRMALGRVENRQLTDRKTSGLQGVEYGVFSQWGEDGILQHLLRQVRVPRNVFVEFGVETYTEANTRFLLMRYNWSGLVIDGSQSNVSTIKRDPIYWKYNLKAVCAFVDRDNIDSLLLENGIKGKIGLLSVDIDGNDYWVWKAITCIQPALVVVEYNARFGSEAAVTVPYNREFVREKAHHSCIYYGASLKAFHLLGQKKGYALVGCNSAGNNAFFVRRELLAPPLREMTVEEAYVPCQFREARGTDGKLVFASPKEEMKILCNLPLESVEGV